MAAAGKAVSMLSVVEDVLQQHGGSDRIGDLDLVEYRKVEQAGMNTVSHFLFIVFSVLESKRMISSLFLLVY